jgi:polysaccharide biosynthesis/export protein
MMPMPYGSIVQQPAGVSMQPGCGPGGCGTGVTSDGAGHGIPVELGMTSHMPYIVEPPDILLLSPIRIIPKPPYTVGPFDVLLIRAAKALPDQPVEGTYTIDPSGSINLGYSYGYLRVGGLTLEDVEKVVRAALRRAGVTDPQLAIGLAQFRGVQQVQGQHLVRQDGTIALGNYGCVHVAGLTLAQVKVAVERHLTQYLQDPEVGVDVGVYNSKYYYVITDGAGYGESVFKFPITGKETVLDGLAQIGGIPAVGSTKKIWLARPSPATHCCSQILPVDWNAITQAGVTATNYQLFPGDRIYVHSKFLICLDNKVAQIISPIQRIFGVGLLGATTIQTIKNPNGGNGGGATFIAPLRN